MKPLVVANWKMNPQTLSQARRLFNAVKEGIKKIKKVEIVICPPFVYLTKLEKNKKKRTKKIKLGAQDVFWEEKGAFTGEISPQMLKVLGCQYVIIGHSERRRHLREDNKMIGKKLTAALKAKLKPIFCIGETKVEKNKGQALRVLNSQISRGLKNIKEKEAKKLIIAYEPVWAIGTGKPCDSDTVLNRMLLIRGVLKKRYSLPTSKKIKILYGGSVNSENALYYIKVAKMNGLLVGGASLKAEEFIKIIKRASKA
jgi:triosephosphate isomerase